MKYTEEQLARDLHSWAEGVETDAPRMWRSFAHRHLNTAAPVQPPHRRRRWVAPVLVSAAAAVVVTGVGVSLSGLPQGEVEPAAGQQPVAHRWACEQRSTFEPQPYPYVDDNDEIAMSTKHEVDPRKPPQEVAQYGIPRWNYSLQEDSGLLTYGNAEGRKIAETQLHQEDGLWYLGARTACSGPDGRPSTDPAQLGDYVPGRRPFPSGQPPQGERIDTSAKPIVIDDRQYRDAVGILRRQTTYGFLTDRGFGIVPTPNTTWEPTTTMQSDTSGNTAFNLLSDDPPGSDPTTAPNAWFNGNAPAQGEVFAYHATNEDIDFSITNTTTGVQTRAKTFTHPTWDGTLYVALTPPGPDGTQRATIVHANGEVERQRY
jgi:hypothetical protein